MTSHTFLSTLPHSIYADLTSCTTRLKQSLGSISAVPKFLLSHAMKRSGNPCCSSKHGGRCPGASVTGGVAAPLHCLLLTPSHGCTSHNFLPSFVNDSSKTSNQTLQNQNKYFLIFFLDFSSIPSNLVTCYQPGFYLAK